MKKYFITGLLIWIPLVITIWVLKLVVDVLDQSLLLLPTTWQTENWLGIHIPGLGTLLTVLIVFVTGVFATNFFGAQLIELWHEVLHRIPVVNSIYSSVKQISDTLFSSSGQAFRKALLVQWPREGMWTIAFLTGTPSGEVASHLPPESVAVYVPTTPNPTGGYFVIVARKDVIELDMSVDQALKYIISMGVVPPQK
ncbi:MAG: rane protein [Burkholderiales bacterium]|nr:rane protein [Burkholderiales bacterium]